MSRGIDYSKWDNLSVSDDSSAAGDDYNDDSYDDDQQYHEGDDDIVSSLQHQSTDANNDNASSTLSGDYSPAEIALLKKGIAYEKEQDSNDDNDIDWLLVGPLKNIRVHPNDKSTSMYSSIIYTEDPNTYIPDRTDYIDDRVQKWGIEPPSSQEGGRR